MRWTRLIGMLLVGVLALLFPGAPSLAANSSSATLHLSVEAPDGVNALVQIVPVNGSAPTMVVVEPGEHQVDLPRGTYRIEPRTTTVEGTRYVGKASPRQVRIQGRDAFSTVTYSPSQGVQALRVTGLEQTSVQLGWEAQQGQGTMVRRVTGTDPALTPGQGTRVPIQGSTLIDEGLEPGQTYTYSIFARPGDGSIGQQDADPVVITVGTPAEDGGQPGEASFITSPGTHILGQEDLLAVVPTGTGVEVTLADQVPTPVPGDILSLPVGPVLEGGYLGQVVTISPDGRTVGLVQAPLAEAFEFYHLQTGFGDQPVAPQDLEPASTAAAKSMTTPVPQRSPRQDKATTSSSAPAAASSPGPAAMAPSATKAPECKVGGQITMDSRLGMTDAGDIEIIVDKHKIWFVEVPVGVGLDVQYSATLSGAMDITITDSGSCGIDLYGDVKQVTAYPVPMALKVDVGLTASASAAGSMKDLGFATTLGFTMSGHADLKGNHDFTGQPISQTNILQPTGTGELGVGLQAGGSVAFGPGVGTKEAGVLAGVGGSIDVVDASASAVFVEKAGQEEWCLQVSAASGLGIYVTLAAWVSGFSFDATFDVPGLQGTFDWPGSPYHWPQDCTESDAPTDDVVGDGVTVIGDDLTGSSDQWGKVDGFVPGESTWVLSTGRIQDTVGEPSFFASTILGGAGDAELSALANATTYDAVAFSVTVVPNGETLKVRYAFASEEYPEYVGSQYNDVMAVLVDGQNCALVPGSSSPVSINTVNHLTNSAYYVDNSTGAAGYGTTMDGLTTPLTCSRPVTPGEPVTIKIAVADASDSVYDSAVALLDGGIWSE